MLAWTIYLSLLSALVFFCLPPKATKYAPALALGSNLATALLGFLGTLQLTDPGEFATIAHHTWIPQIGANFHLGADGISAALVILTGIASIAGILFSWNVEHRAGHFFGFYQLLITGVYGVFLSADLLLLFVFYEIAIVPKYFLIAIWGSKGSATTPTREYAAMKLALYSFGGSALVLLGVIVAWLASGRHTFDLMALSQMALSLDLQYWLFPMTFLGFAVLAGLWPFHTWAPTGHAAAPTAASMLLAGVVMKLGAYGCLRVAMPLFPEGLAAWAPTIGVLAVAGIVLGAGVALTQSDFKYVIGYSSVSHMGFVLLGLATASSIGVTGAVLQMVSHGIIAGLLFAVAGRMIYERTHTRDFALLGPLRLDRQLPFAAIVFLLAACASMGLPGFSGFVAELTVLIAAWREFPRLTIVAAVGVLVGVAFTFRAVLKVFYSDYPAPPETGPLPPITWPEKAGALLLLTATIVIGLYPRWLLDLIVPAVSSPFFERIIRSHS